MSLIHKTAIVSENANLADNVSVGPYSIIGPEVTIGESSVIDSHVIIKGSTTIGEDNHIYSFVSIGDDPQDKKFDNEDTKVEIGDRNTIREYTTINKGTSQDIGITR